MSHQDRLSEASVQQSIAAAHRHYHEMESTDRELLGSHP